MQVKVLDGIPVVPVEAEDFVANPFEWLPIKKRKRVRKKAADLGIAEMKPRQRAALKNYMENGMKNRTRAAIEAGYSPLTAGHVIGPLLRRKPIVKALEDKGITDQKIAGVISDGLEAMHPIKPKQPDHNARAKFVSEANKIKDNYPAKRIEVDERVMVIQVSADDIKALNDFKRLRDAAD